MTWNVFEGDTRTPGNPDTLPTPGDLSGPCPRCGRTSNFTLNEGKSHILRQFRLKNRMGPTYDRVDVLT
jgi:hypothetical protein